MSDSAYFTEKPPIDKGYWRLSIDPVTHSTLIDFYGHNHKLVYQEIIPNSPVKLTPQRRGLLDQVAERITSERLLASADPTAGFGGPRPATDAAETVLTTYEAASQSGFRTNSYVTTGGTLRVNWDKRDPTFVDLSLLDKARQPLYAERTATNQFRRAYDLRGLADGTYTLLLTHAQRFYTFRVSLRHDRTPKYVVTPQTPRTLAGALVE